MALFSINFCKKWRLNKENYFLADFLDSTIFSLRIL